VRPLDPPLRPPHPGPGTAALEGRPSTAGRTEIARGLSSLLMRTEDERVEGALFRLLSQDSEARVRAVVARQFGLQRWAPAVPFLQERLTDEDGEVGSAVYYRKMEPTRMASAPERGPIIVLGVERSGTSVATEMVYRRDAHARRTSGGYQWHAQSLSTG